MVKRKFVKSKKQQAKEEYDRLMQLNKIIFFSLGLAKLAEAEELENLILSAYFKAEKELSTEEKNRVQELFEKGNSLKRELMGSEVE